MDHEQIIYMLELSTVALYGLVIVILILHWPNEASVYLIHFCLSNGIMAIAASGILESMADRDVSKCRATGILCVFGLALGFESLYRSQCKACQTARTHFRLYVTRIKYPTVAVCWIIPVALSFIPWSYYRKNAALRTCFVGSFGRVSLDETAVGIVSLILIYLRPVVLTLKRTINVTCSCFRQFKTLGHERKLLIQSHFFLYKDHQRRLFHAVHIMALQVHILIWMVLTVPFMIYILGLVAGLNKTLDLDNLPSPQLFMMTSACKTLPCLNALVFIVAFGVYLLLKL